MVPFSEASTVEGPLVDGTFGAPSTRSTTHAACLTVRSRRLHAVFTRCAEAPSVRTLASSAKATGAIEIVVVRTPACHLCADTIEALEELGHSFPLDVRVVEIDSEEGRAIAARHRTALFPAVVTNGRLFSSGRLPQKKLPRLLERTI